MTRGIFDVLYTFQPDCQNLTCHIFKATQHLVKDSDHDICQNIFRQIFEKVSIRQNFPRQNFPLYGNVFLTVFIKGTKLSFWKNNM